MIIKKKKQVESLPASMEAVLTLYPDPVQNKEDREKLESVIQVLSGSPEAFRGNYTCYVEKEALEKFMKHANDIYNQNGHEATGLFVGYYLHSLEDERQKIAIATEFLPAFGNTSITCEISYEETAQNAVYCEKHKVLPLVWPHTHPFNRPLFYSSIDSDTLACDFSAPHQMGFVCDNLRNAYAGFKIINGKECQESLYCLNLRDSLGSGNFIFESLYEKPLSCGNNNSELHEHKEDKESIPMDTKAPSHLNCSDIASLVDLHSYQFNKIYHLLVIDTVIQLFMLAWLLFFTAYVFYS